jgi:hypothetical protein
VNIEFKCPKLRFEFRFLCGDVPEVLPEEARLYNDGFLDGFQHGVKTGYFANPDHPDTTALPLDVFESYDDLLARDDFMNGG